ncbi:MAG TPA: site-2 protease family protein [Methylocystis sp.]|nr:site-2 protease family protein [Methylocystis sp.]
MGWSITIGRFAGTAVRIHVTFLLFLAWIGFSAYQHGGSAAALDSVLFIVSIFSCVVLHEFGHILVARRFGVQSSQVTLLPIGGVADLAKMPEKPSQELLIALAGPAVNVVIASALLMILGAFQPSALTHLDDPNVSLLERLAAANLFLAIFNMVPAFPMDGGRVLRAALAFWLGQARATRVAALIGQGLAFVLGFLGLFGNPILLFIAFFVYFAAAGEAQLTTVSEAMKGVSVASVMETRVAPISRGATVGEAVELLLATSQDSFPVVDAAGRFAGLLSREDIAEAIRTAESGAPIAPFAHREVPTVAPDEMLDKAFEKLTGDATIGVVDAEGGYRGLLSRQSIAEVMLIKSARPDWRFARRG